MTPLSEASHYRRPEERPYTRAERGNTTLLLGGLTWKHDTFLGAFLQRLGHRVEVLPPADLESYRVGSQAAGTGQCNPLYFNAGNLIKYLRVREAGGQSRDELVEGHVFLMPGSCGPCRYGMYESGFRLALEHAGFSGFRVLTYDMEGQVNQPGSGGLKIDLRFFEALIGGLILGDLGSDLSYKVRPYEVRPGQTDEVIGTLVERLCQKIRALPARGREGRLARRLPGMLRSVLRGLADLRHVAGLLVAPALPRLLRSVATMLDEIEVDYTRLRPRVKVIGEIWAQITESDGSYRVQSFLEREGAEVVPECLTNFVLYVLHMERQGLRERGYLPLSELRRDRVRPGVALWHKLTGPLRVWGLGALERLVTLTYDRMRRALSPGLQRLPSQRELEALARPFFNPRIEGGEGHQEVAKTIYYQQRGLCHLTVSVKPFGCMPSTQSDGVQSLLTNRLPGLLFVPMETSGEGRVSALSRVQMALADAHAAAREELEELTRAAPVPRELLDAYLADRPELRRAASGRASLPEGGSTAAGFTRRLLAGHEERGGAQGETDAG